jgi:hypothetical protein
MKSTGVFYLMVPLLSSAVVSWASHSPGVMPTQRRKTR